MQAALEAADEIGLAVVATTLAIVAVFIPVSFMSGVPGQFFRQFGISVAIAVLFSLLVARLLTPVMGAYLLKPHDENIHESRVMKTAICAWCDWGLAHRKLALLSGVAAVRRRRWRMAPFLRQDLHPGVRPRAGDDQLRAAAGHAAGGNRGRGRAARARSSRSTRK